MKKMDCFRALRYSNRMTIAGAAATVICVLIWGEGILPALFGVLAVVGGAVAVVGTVIGYRFTVCPHCGEPLYDFPRMPSEIPAYCPHCGKKLDPPADH